MKRFFYLALLGFLASCQGLDPIVIPSVPEIELIMVSTTEVQAFNDPIEFEIRYTDGDGDLGTNDDTERNVFIIDNRIGTMHAFRLQQVAPDGADIAVTGTFVLTLPNTIITDNSSQQSVVFTIYLVDRAGNESNRIDSPEILVNA